MCWYVLMEYIYSIFLLWLHLLCILRVGFWEAAKWVAKVRDVTCPHCSSSVILKTNMEAGGHFGEGGRYAQSEETSYDYAFLLKAMGMLKNEE